MALDLRGFNSGEDDFAGLYKLGDTAFRNKQLDEQKAERDQNEKDKQEQRQNSQSQFFTNFLNKKDHITGTMYDTNTSALLGKALNQAYQLTSNGSSSADTMMAIQPLIDQVNQYDSKAKTYVQNRDKILDYYGKQKGYNVPEIRDQLDKSTFYKTDPKTGQSVLDIDNADPTLNTALQDINANHLHEITNGAGISDWVKNQPSELRDGSFSDMDSHGNKSFHKLNIKAANWEQPESDGKGGYNFVPKHDVAADNTVPIEHTFVQSDGTKVKAPVRLLDNNVFSNLMDSESARDHILGQLKQTLSTYKDSDGKEIALHSPKAEMVAKAIAYDYLKSHTSGNVVTAERNSLSAPQIRLNFTGSPYAPQRASSASGSDVPIDEVSKSIQSDLQKMKAQGIDHLPVENMSNTAARDIILAEAKKTGRSYKPNQLRITEGDDGTTRVFDNAGNFISYINTTELDKAANKGGGQKANNKIVSRTTQPSTTTKNSIPSTLNASEWKKKK